MHTVNFLTNLVEHHQVWAYFAIFIGLIFEGEIILISTGVLAHLGAIDFSFALLFVFCGGMVKTFLGYYVGTIIHDKFKHMKFFRYIEHRVHDIMPRFRQKPFWSIFVSKFIMGANYIVIIFSGFKRVPFKTYLKAEIIATIIWAPLLMSVGYAFSHTALSISKEIWRFLLIVLLLTVAFIIIDKMVGWFYEIFEEVYDEEK